MAKVIDLKAERDKREMVVVLEGKGRCSDCKAQWDAIAEPGVFALECPSCGGMRGYFMGHIVRPGLQVFTCLHCEGQAFQLYEDRTGLTCIGCGFIHTWESVQS